MSSVLVAGTCLLASYVGTSLVLLRWPRLLHQKKRLAFAACAHISHRGGAGERLENTMAAFKHAVHTCGCQMLEIDCQLTRDGKVVVAHDDHLVRTCDHDDHVHQLDYRDLPLLRHRLPLQFDTETICEVPEDGDRRIPLLEELFKEFPDLPINVDIKSPNPLLVGKVGDLIKRYNREPLTPWGNFQDAVTDRCYEHNPNIPLLFSLQACVRYVALFYTGLLPFVPIRQSCLEIAPPWVFLERRHAQVRPDGRLRVLLRIMNVLVLGVRPDIFGRCVLMRPSLFRHLRRRGIHVYMWVLNDEDQFRRAFEVGASGVMTDFPSRLRNWLDANPQYQRDPLLDEE